MNATAKCYRTGQPLNGIYFFVLNKGYNSGKPGVNPWVNCYVIYCKTEEDRNRLYYLCYALWITGKFKQLLVGSVIEFLRIHDFKKVLDIAECKTHACADQLTACIEHLIASDKKIASLNYTLLMHQRFQYELLRALLT
jgi:hypothetical protein